MKNNFARIEANPDVKVALESFIARLNELNQAKHIANGFTNFKADTVVCKERAKYFAIDFCQTRQDGTVNELGSGAWLVEKATGEIFNIKAYGVADQNKKRKADLGNVLTADPENVFNGRYNYLR